MIIPSLEERTAADYAKLVKDIDRLYALAKREVVYNGKMTFRRLYLRRRKVRLNAALHRIRAHPDYEAAASKLDCAIQRFQAQNGSKLIAQLYGETSPEYLIDALRNMENVCAALISSDSAF